MRFWDSSAILALLVPEAASPVVAALLASDDAVVVWWATYVECVSGLARRRRLGELDEVSFQAALTRLDVVAAVWQQQAALAEVRASAVRLLRTHALRAADALQLAAADVFAGANARSLPFVTLDQHLANAAAREGFPVLP
jgi:predicted nucleic acid-binding protein